MWPVWMGAPIWAPTACPVSRASESLSSVRDVTPFPACGIAVIPEDTHANSPMRMLYMDFDTVVARARLSGVHERLSVASTAVCDHCAATVRKLKSGYEYVALQFSPGHTRACCSRGYWRLHCDVCDSGGCLQPADQGWQQRCADA